MCTVFVKISDPFNILKETSNEKSELVLLEWTARLRRHFVLCDMSLVNTFIIAIYDVMKYLLHVPNYRRPSVTRTLVTLLPRLFKNSFSGPFEKSHKCRFRII